MTILKTAARETRKTGVPGEKPLGALGDNQQQTQPTYGVDARI